MVPVVSDASILRPQIGGGGAPWWSLFSSKFHRIFSNCLSSCGNESMNILMRRSLCRSLLVVSGNSLCYSVVDANLTIRGGCTVAELV
ncbi:hypothetical protein GDO81_029697 [Engystomops pustulosus]|uniref:Uncharacterized protein n=1 Tax=Engystomops pustulosus TaxID=76066 RepID=A0AAV6YFV2_ENGPU|nr:hypothetical protein GDO81_029697 [Engystomops pustulosus]